MMGFEYTLRLSTGEKIEVVEMFEPESKEMGANYLIEKEFVTLISNEESEQIRLGNDRIFKGKIQGEPVRCLTKVQPKKCKYSGPNCAQYKARDCVTTALSRIPPCWESDHSDKNTEKWITFCVACLRSGQWVILVRD